MMFRLGLNGLTSSVSRNIIFTQFRWYSRPGFGSNRPVDKKKQLQSAYSLQKKNNRGPKVFRVSPPSKDVRDSKKKPNSSDEPKRLTKKQVEDAKRSRFGFGDHTGLERPDADSSDRVKKLLDKVTTLEALRILPEIRNAMTEEVSSKARRDDYTVKPTPVQIASIKAIQSKRGHPNELRTYLVAAETGSGKTWAYLAPMLSKMAEEQMAPEWEQVSSRPSVRSVILLPTHELVDQVYEVLERTQSSLDFHYFKYGAGVPFRDFSKAFKNRIDVLVTTPGKLQALKALKSSSEINTIFYGVRFTAVDEADSLMDRSWLEETYNTITMLPNTRDLVFCSATIPKEFSKTMDRLFPNAISIATPQLHKIPRSIDFKVIDADVAPYRGSKVKALAQVLYAIHCDGTEPGLEKRVIIFVNEKKLVPYLSEKLSKEYLHDAISLTGEDDSIQRKNKISFFLNPARTLEDVEQEISSIEDKSEVRGVIATNSGKIQQKLKVLVTTDVLARGLNFMGIKNVILYDIPKTSIDLVHRVGRTGRMKQSGRVFMITQKSEMKPWVKGLAKAVKNGVPLS